MMSIEEKIEALALEIYASLVVLAPEATYQTPVLAVWPVVAATARGAAEVFYAGP